MRPREAALWGVVCAFALAAASPVHAQMPRIDVNAGPLGDALADLGDALGISIFAPNTLVAGKTARPVSGSLTPEQALRTLLQGSGLIAKPASNGGFIIAEQAARANAPREIRPVVAETIFVTGQQIDRTLQDTKESVAVLTAQDIESRSLLDLDDVLLQSANVAGPG
ncbi:MAG: STN domain-containing protein, partial [Pseudomonadota bacterium]